MVLTLYKNDVSSPARAAMMVLELLQLPDVVLQDVNYLAGDHLKQEYLEINPQHTMPTLVDGDFIVWDSHAIAAYLVTQYGAEDSLYPKDPKKRALVDQRLHFDTGVLFEIFRVPARRILYNGGTTIEAEDVERYHTAYGFLEKFLTGSNWLAGDTLTIADICCVATVSTMNELIPIDADNEPLYVLHCVCRNVVSTPELVSSITWPDHCHFNWRILYPNITRWLQNLSKKDFYVKKNQAGCTAWGNAIRSQIA